jgi:pimeloyl-ACP methyl ester carboxylesterase
VLRALAAGALGWQAARLLRAFARDVADYRRSAAVLRSVRTTVAVPGARRPLALHARIAERVRGAGPSIVLVHGYGVSSRYFVPLAARLAATSRVYAPDLPGHGASDAADAPLSVPGLALALGAWMDARGLRGALLVGQSMGAQVATELAMRRPALVAGLVLVAPAVDPNARSVVRQVARAARTAFAERPLLDAWAAVDYARAGPQLIAREMRHMLGHRLEELLPALDVPVRVVRGARDRISPRDWTDAVARGAGASRAIEVPRAAHAVQYSAPAAVAEVVRALAAELGRDARALDGAGRSEDPPAAPSTYSPLTHERAPAPPGLTSGARRGPSP